MKPVLLFIPLFFYIHAYCQNDFVALQRHNRNIKHYFKGSRIQFFTQQNVLVEGYITKCINDSIYLHLGYMGVVPTAFGAKEDTIFRGYDGYSLKEIKLIPAKRFSAANAANLVVKMGLIGGGIVAVNNLNINQPYNYLVEFFSAIAINFGVSFINIFKNKPTGYHIGKRYTLKYIRISNTNR
jgi:hypothetical protein